MGSIEHGHLKQRLLGAIVLVALAVIFIPMLLSGGRDVDMPVFGSNVPERSPEIKNIKHIDIAEAQSTEPQSINPKTIPVAPGVAEPEVVEEEKPNVIVETITELTKDEKKPSIKETVWAVQVGSFSNRSNAFALKEKLRKSKVHAFVERVMNDGKATYRVRVGPEISKEKAEALKEQLKKDFKLTGLVVKHP